MITLAQAYILPLNIAFLIGIATGWWMWSRLRWNPKAEGGYADGNRNDVASTQWMPAAERDEPVKDTAAPSVAALAAALTTETSSAIAPSKRKRAVPTASAVEAIAVKPRKKRLAKPETALNAIGIPVAIGTPNDLLQIKGIGPKLNALLNRLGVTRFDQIAAWKAKEIGAVDSHLGAFQGRITRDDWIDQASLLANGQITSFEARYGKLDSENN
jgi:predicted flap endonuclease-1-like 5' DNA nuclease